MTEEKKEEGSLAVKEVPSEKKAKSPDEHLELAKKNQDKLDPEHPRFKEVYAKMKDHERALSEKEKDIDALREHTQAMERRLSEIADKKADKSLPAEPDAELDPVAHKAWMRVKKAEEEKLADQKEFDREVSLAIRIAASNHDDYDEVVKLAEKEMAKKPELRKEIWKDPVMAPARAYKLGKKLIEERSKVEDEEKERQARLKKGEVLKDGGEADSGDDEEIKLSEAQKRVVRNLYPDMAFKDAEARYIKSLKSLGGN